jgi:hypothetical protein
MLFFFIFSQIYSQWVFKPHNDISVFHGGRYCEILITNPLTGVATDNNQNVNLSSAIHMLPV